MRLAVETDYEMDLETILETFIEETLGYEKIPEKQRHPASVLDRNGWRDPKRPHLLIEVGFDRHKRILLLREKDTSELVECHGCRFTIRLAEALKLEEVGSWFQCNLGWECGLCMPCKG